MLFVERTLHRSIFDFIRPVNRSETRSIRNLAGLSFWTKAPGVFLLVLIGSTYLFDIVVLRKMDRWRTRAPRLLGIAVVSVGGFTISWLGTNPYVLKHPHLFLQDLQYERNHVAVGHGRVDNTKALFWIEAR